MRALVKLAIAALIANAAWRVGSAYVIDFRFKDSVQEAARFRGKKTNDEILQRVFDLASDYDIPVDYSTMSIKSEQDHTIVDGYYTRSIDLLPGYTYDWPFTIHLDTITTERPTFAFPPPRR